MFEVSGKYTSAKIFANFVEETAMSQIYNILNQSMFKDAKIAIMCDVHAGSGAVIGFTAQMTDIVVPNLIGVDINCGMYNVKLGDINVDFAKLDDLIYKSIPYGTGAMNTSLDKSITDKTYLEGVQTEKIWAPVGCEKCHKTGYKGRLAITEIILMKKEIEEARKFNFKIATLGPLTLRGETAAIIATYLVSNLC